ncbi:hypothetical protein CEXT_395111 [Caerostris extrusa]|uniref:Uncharacterized protein n=1 Tax=Caerostris extrusa TaxID=172846 RepID=A0AAV4S6E9_CAEEX|nr:hypothetical protein CEXT_395111 [Caerostris extrusa]
MNRILSKEFKSFFGRVFSGNTSGRLARSLGKYGNSLSMRLTLLATIDRGRDSIRPAILHFVVKWGHLRVSRKSRGISFISLGPVVEMDKFLVVFAGCINESRSRRDQQNTEQKTIMGGLQIPTLHLK